MSLPQLQDKIINIVLAAVTAVFIAVSDNSSVLLQLHTYSPTLACLGKDNLLT